MKRETIEEEKNVSRDLGGICHVDLLEPTNPKIGLVQLDVAHTQTVFGSVRMLTQRDYYK